MKEKGQLVRVVKSPEGEVSVDFSGKKPGRGAYLCSDLTCFKKVVKSGALSRAFKTPVSEDIINQLEQQLSASHLKHQQHQ